MVQTRSTSTRSLTAQATLSPRRSRTSLRALGAAPGQTEEDLVAQIERQAELDALKEKGDVAGYVNGLIGGKLGKRSTAHYECESWVRQLVEAPLTKGAVGGPPGALGITLAVAFFSYWVQLNCDRRGCPATPLGKLWDPAALAEPAFWRKLWDTRTAAVWAGWYLWCLACWVVLPGRLVEGTPLRDGKRLFYKMNGASRNLCRHNDETDERRQPCRR